MKNTAACIIVALSAAGCAGLTQMQDTIGKFDEGAHAVAAAQMGFLRQVQIADCNSQFYAAAFNWAAGGTDALDLSAACTPTLLDDEQLGKRQALVDAVTLYADKIQALAADDANQSLDDGSVRHANALNGMARERGFQSVSLAAGAEAGVLAIAEMALDRRKFRDIRDAAKAMSPALSKVVESLKTENALAAAAMTSKMGQIQIQLKAALSEGRAAAMWQSKSAGRNSPTSARSFLDVIAARGIVRSVNPLGAVPFAPTRGADRSLDPGSAASELNAALDALVNANNALASAGSGGTRAAVHDLIARARRASDTLAALNR